MNPTVSVIYKDDDLIVINKPPGLPVHGGASISGEILTDFLVAEFPEIREVGDDPAIRPGIVHRLDKDTSGVMIVARTQQAFERLKYLFKNRLVEKTYIAVVCGVARKKQGTIALPIGRLVKNPLKRGIAGAKTRVSGERQALTEYRVLKESDAYSLMELKPKTGRMHQLRVHMKALGNPIACDRLYGGKHVRCPMEGGRTLLHALSISFALREGRRLLFEVEPPDDFSKAINMLGLGY